MRLSSQCPRCGMTTPTVSCIEGDSLVVRCGNSHVVERTPVGVEPIRHQRLSAWIGKLKSGEPAPLSC